MSKKLSILICLLLTFFSLNAQIQSLQDSTCSISSLPLPSFSDQINTNWNLCKSQLTDSLELRDSTAYTIRSNVSDMTVVQDSSTWYNFITSSNGRSIYRLDYGNDLSNTPTNTKLTAFGSTFTSLSLLDIKRKDNIFHGVMGNINDGKIIPFFFPNGLSQEPVMLTNASIPTFTNLKSIDLTVQGDSVFLFVGSFSPTSVTKLSFYNDLSDTNFNTNLIPITFNQTIGADLLPTENGFFYCTYTNSGGANLMRFENAFDAPAQTWSFIPGLTNRRNMLMIPTQNKIKFLIVGNNIISDFEFDTTDFSISSVRNNILDPSINYDQFIGAIDYVPSNGTDVVLLNNQKSAVLSEMLHFEFKNSCQPVNDIRQVEYTAYDTLNDKYIYLRDSIYLFPNPETSLTSSFTCTDTPTQFFDNVNLNNDLITNFQWTIDGNEINTTGNNTPFTFTSTGDKEVKLKVTDVCMKEDSITQTISIVDKNDISTSFTFTDTLCTQADVMFNNTSTFVVDSIQEYLWIIRNASLDTIFSSLDSNTQFSFSDAGMYDVYLKNTGKSGCSTDLLTPISPLQGPRAEFLSTDSCFLQQFLAFESSADPSISKIEWFIADTLFSTENIITLQNDAIESRTIKLKTFNSIGCETEAVRTYTVNPLPQSDFDSTFFCLNQPQQVLNRSTISNSTPITYQWFYNNAEISTDENPQLSLDEINLDTLTLVTTSLAGCKDTISKRISIFDLPTANFTFENSCFGDPTALRDSSVSNRTITSWKWEVAGSTINSKDINFTFPTPQSFSVVLVVEDNLTCKDSITKNVIVDPLPSASFTNSVICQNTTTEFISTSTSSNDSITQTIWSFIGFGNVQDGDTSYFSFPTVGSNLVQINLLTKKGCTASLTKTIDVNTRPTSNFTIPELVGAPTFVVIPNNESTNADSYLWTSPLAGITNTDPEPTLSFSSFGNYDINLVASSTEGCNDTSSVSIQVVDPVVDLALNNLNFVNNGGTVTLNFNLTNLGNFTLDSTLLNVDYGGILQSQQLLPNSISNSETVSITLGQTISTEQFNSLHYICLTSKANQSLANETNLANNKNCILLDDEFRVDEIFPLPVSEKLNVSYFLPQETDVTIELHNSLGYLVYSTEKSNQSAGPYEETLDLSNLLDEFYILTVKTSNKKIVKRITKI